ncbi:hypothetical protein EDC01DRAFT_307003 [Geopyxis carbonaria]|nr:hypothetical protein EDC01DRAFT_307003 [Geopyxis carbonaria]
MRPAWSCSALPPPARTTVTIAILLVRGLLQHCYVCNMQHYSVLIDSATHLKPGNHRMPHATRRPLRRRRVSETHKPRPSLRQPQQNKMRPTSPSYAIPAGRRPNHTPHSPAHTMQQNEAPPSHRATEPRLHVLCAACTPPTPHTHGTVASPSLAATRHTSGLLAARTGLRWAMVREMVPCRRCCAARLLRAPQAREPPTVRPGSAAPRAGVGTDDTIQRIHTEL